MKSFSELQTELRLAIIRGYTTAALEATEALFYMIGTNTGLKEPQPLAVHWDDIQGKPNMCDPSKCACKTSGDQPTDDFVNLAAPVFQKISKSNALINTDRGVFNGANPVAFDHDGDGKPGGSKKGSRKKEV